MTDPTVTWRATFAASGQSTSAQLREVQAALAASQADLAASQADLTAMQAERDQFRSNYVRDAARLDDLEADLVNMEIARDDARAEAKEWRAIAEQYLSQRDDALHDLAHAKFVLSTAKIRVDELERSARQVRLDNRGDSTVHDIHISFADPSGIAYLTCCDQVLMAVDGAILTTRESTCAPCRRAQ